MSNGTNIVATALCAGVVFAAAMAGEAAGTATESRNVADYHAIDFRGTGRLDIVAGQRHAVQVSGEREAVSQVRTRVRNGVLVISTEGGFGWWGNASPVRLQISLPQLSALTVSGMGDTDVRGMAGGKTTFLMQGNSSLRVEGHADAVEAQINGRGTADLSRLRAGRATVQVNGSGEVQVAATTSLDAALNGVGSSGPARGGF